MDHLWNASVRTRRRVDVGIATVREESDWLGQIQEHITSTVDTLDGRYRWIDDVDSALTALVSLREAGEMQSTAYENALHRMWFLLTGDSRRMDVADVMLKILRYPGIF